jgi:amino acid adenylation domain-containing protein
MRASDLSSAWDQETVPQAFARQVAEHPDDLALTALDGDLTYAELDARANRLAHGLRGLGVTRGSAVGVCADRSAHLVVALLAVLKAGGGYLALDPREPVSRLARFLLDADAEVVLTEASLAARIEAIAGTPVVLDGPGGSFADLPATPPGTDPSPADVAYFAYTSGSTGRPKGVCVPHRAVSRLVVGTDFITIRPDDVFLQLAPLAFDASVLEIWGPLLNGGRLVMAPPGDLSPQEISALVRGNGVTVLWLTAGLFHVMTDEGLADLQGLRYLLAGGDVLSVEHVNRALRELPATTLINGYGPTENTTFTTCHTITGPVLGSRVPIGRPIRGTSVYLLDENMAQVPDGSVGEIYTGGLGLAHGYLNSPQLTAERFVRNPFSAGPDERLYRTGDLAIRSADGVLEFHGRVDRQVKVRGFRIEPAEIEAALRAHPDIADAVVVPRDRPGAERDLMAAYVSAEVLTAAELRRHLSMTLPPYLLPAAYLRLDRLPLMTTGKVDRAALAELALPARPDLSTEFRAPDSPIARWLAELWADLLGIASVGVEDDFFELGGHSLIAARITNEVMAEFGIFVSAVTFYEEPTIAGLSSFVAGQLAETGEPPRPDVSLGTSLQGARRLRERHENHRSRATLGRH